MSLSDLELVAQAMAPTTQAAPPGQTESESAHARALTSNSNLQQASGDLQPREPKSVSTPPDANTSTGATNGNGQISIPGIDPSLLANLSAADLASLQPLIQALSLQPGEGEEGDDMDELDENDPRIQDILRQMDVAGDVADDLEDKLDKLIAALGEEECKMEEAVEAGKASVEKGEAQQQEQEGEKP